MNNELLPQLTKLECRTNVMVVHFFIDEQPKYIIIYDDHRYLLNVLFYAKNKGILDSAVNLLYFDLHDDATSPICKNNYPNMSKVNEREFFSFVEFDMSCDDSTWLITGMDLGLIANATNIGGKNINELNVLNGKYGNHYINSLPFQKLNKKSEIQPNGIAINTIIEPFVLDFDLDLDCFNKYDPASFKSLFVDNIIINDCIKNWVQRAAFITICREPRWCTNGIFGSNRWLELLDYYFFSKAIKGYYN